jgi:hypothetical protein
MVADVTTTPIISPRQRAPERTLNRILRICWVVALYIAVFLLLVKIFVAFDEVESLNSFVMTSIVVLLILFLLYLLFLAEGMILVAAQIKPCDKDKVCAFIRENFPSHSYVLTNIVEIVQESYDNFIIGRQIIAIFAVVGLVLLVGSLNENPNNLVFSYLNTLYPGAGTIGFSVINHDTIIFLIGTLLPCWICQLLPHFLAEDRSFQFSKLPFAKTFIDISVNLSRFEAGWPSLLLLRSIQNRGHFGGAEEISVGDAAIFRANAAYQGYHIAERVITITCAATETAVEDKSTYEFRGGTTSDIKHSVKVSAMSNIGLSGWRYEYPADWKKEDRGDPITNLIVLTANPPDSKAIEEAKESDASPTPTPPAEQDRLIEEVVLMSTIPLRIPIPRRGKQGEKFGVTVTYTVAPLSTDMFEDDDFFFEIGKPTQSIVLEIKRAPGTFIRPPVIALQPAEELPFFTDPRRLDTERAPAVESADGWRVTVPYPPVGTRLFLTLDARESGT